MSERPLCRVVSWWTIKLRNSTVQCDPTEIRERGRGRRYSEVQQIIVVCGTWPYTPHIKTTQVGMTHAAVIKSGSSLDISRSLSFCVLFCFSEPLKHSYFSVALSWHLRHWPSLFLSLCHIHAHRQMDERGTPHLYQGFRNVWQRMEENCQPHQNTYCCPDTYARSKVFFKINKSQTERGRCFNWWKSIRGGGTKGLFLNIFIFI